MLVLPWPLSLLILLPLLWVLCWLLLSLQV
jgi:hypothetical protein